VADTEACQNYQATMQAISYCPYGFWNCLNINLNPGYWAVSGFGNEIRSVENGCDFWTSFNYGLQGTAGLVATGAFAGGVVTGGSALIRLINPNSAIATADVAKFSQYAFVTDKAPVFESYGYTIDDSQQLANLYEQQAQAKFASGDYSLGELDQYGQRITIPIDLPGQGVAAGRSTVIYSGWMIEGNNSIRLLTPFAGFGQ
jgi:hypothetical protein